MPTTCLVAGAGRVKDGLCGYRMVVGRCEGEEVGQSLQDGGRDALWWSSEKGQEIQLVQSPSW